MKRTITAAAALIGLATAFGPAGTASAASLPDGTPVIEVGGRHFGGHRSGHRSGHRAGHRSGHRGGYHTADTISGAAGPGTSGTAYTGTCHQEDSRRTGSKYGVSTLKVGFSWGSPSTHRVGLFGSERLR